ncbi:MAG TPA: NIPSNAP family protein [Bradyrhizobium sp.]|nr:NIPSNAP family protein [Bradyrhizobium sp.]
MIIDLRTYMLSPGLLPDFLEKYEAEGLPIQKEYLGLPIGYFYTEIGALNQVVHMWGYESLADREQKRGRMEADPRWWDYRNRMTPFGHLSNQENKILKPARFSPLGGNK